MPTSSPTGSTSRRAQSTWTFRHSISNEHGYDPFAIPNMGSNTDTDVHQLVFSNTRTIGSNKLNDARFGFGYLKNGHISPRANNENVVKALGINLPSDNPLYWGVPNINVTGLSGLGEESDAPVHQQRQDDSVRRQLHVDRVQAFLQAGRRDPARDLRPDRRRRDARPVCVRRPLHAEPAGAGRLARRRGVRRFSPRALQPFRSAGRRADCQLPLQLLRALRAGQLAPWVERHDELRAALGVRPALRRHQRRDREHRLRLGELARADLRPRRNRRSV